MVSKGAVLLRVQYLQQCTGGIAGVILAQLIHLIQYHDRIGSAAALDAFHNTSRHGTHISTSVSADLSFILDTAKADTYIRTLQGFGNALANTGLTGTRCAHEQQNGTGLLLVQCHHGNLLDDTLLCLFSP